MQTVLQLCIGSSLTESSPRFSFFSILSVYFVVFCSLHISTLPKPKNAPTGQTLEKKKKNCLERLQFLKVCRRGLPLHSRCPPPRRFPLRLPDLICTSRSTAKDYGQAEAGGNRRPRFPRLCLTAAGKERETLRPSHVQWRLRKKKKR